MKHYGRNRRSFEILVKEGFPIALVGNKWVCNTDLADAWFEAKILKKPSAGPEKNRLETVYEIVMAGIREIVTSNDESTVRNTLSGIQAEIDNIFDDLDKNVVRTDIF